MVRQATRWVLVAAVIVAAALAGTGAPAAPAPGAIVPAGSGPYAPDSYIVVLEETPGLRTGGVAASASGLARRFGGTVDRVFQHALRGFEVRMSEVRARSLAADPAVSYVQRNGIVSIQDTELGPPSWGLDRIDQRALPLDDSYEYPSGAPAVHAYVIDTGVRFTHDTFGGRATSGRDTVGNDNDATDCHGHGTHVAGTLGGRGYGVAKEVRVVGVRVLGCDGRGTTAQVVAGIDWVTANAVRPAVANMSLGGGGNVAIDDAVVRSIGSGITYTVSAGNGDVFGNRLNACTFSPARVPEAITVGATQIDDAAATFSNFGTCVDILAPGVAITSAWMTSDSATNIISGTSMAAPHVAGAAALVLQEHPTFTPQQVRDTLIANATQNVVTDPGTGTPNRLLFVANPPPADDFSISVGPTAGTVTAGGSTTATVSTEITNGSPQPVTLSASGLPPRATASFDPPSVTSGGSSTVTFSTVAATMLGAFDVSIVGTGTSAKHQTTFTLIVVGQGGGSCTASNGTNLNVTDDNTYEFSIIRFTGCGRAPSATATVEVRIIHRHRGDVVLDLIAPDGSVFPLKSWNFFDSGDNVQHTYSLDLSRKGANGIWQLRVRDAFRGDAGYVDSWRLNL